MNFHDWITQKYIDWRGNAVGHEKTITEYAAWIGVSQPTMSNWMSTTGKSPITQKSITKLAHRYGLEVYAVLDLPTPEHIPDPDLQPLAEAILLYPPELRPAVRQAIRETLEKYAQQNLSPSDYEKTFTVALLEQLTSIAQTDLDARHRLASPVDWLNL